MAIGGFPHLLQLQIRSDYGICIDMAVESPLLAVVVVMLRGNVDVILLATISSFLATIGCLVGTISTSLLERTPSLITVLCLAFRKFFSSSCYESQASVQNFFVSRGLDKGVGALQNMIKGMLN